jgi:hypothetical protein
LFESIPTDAAHVRIRNAALAPLAAFLFVQVYFTLYPLLPRVPAALFWFIVLVLFAGVVAGAVMLVRAVRGQRLRGAALAWFIAAIAFEIVTAWLCLTLTFPWL